MFATSHTLLASLLLPLVLSATTGKTQVAITAQSYTMTAVLSYGEVVMQDESTTATIDPGQTSEFGGVPISAVPERTAIVLDGSQTFVFTVVKNHSALKTVTTTVVAESTPLAASSAGVTSLSMAGGTGGAALPYAVITGDDNGAITVTPVSSSYMLKASASSTIIGAGDAASFAGATISALSNTVGVVANSFTFTLSKPTSTLASGTLAVATVTVTSNPMSTSKSKSKSKSISKIKTKTKTKSKTTSRTRSTSTSTTPDSRLVSILKLLPPSSLSPTSPSESCTLSSASEYRPTSTSTQTVCTLPSATYRLARRSNHGDEANQTSRTLTSLVSSTSTVSAQPSSPVSTGNAAAGTFTRGDLSAMGWLTSSFGMLMLAFGL